MNRYLLLFVAYRLVCAAELPTDWIDPDTGHRVIRLSREDGTQSLYFNQNAYTADGKRIIVTTAGGGISTITLATREVTPLVQGLSLSWWRDTLPETSITRSARQASPSCMPRM
jgi:oligogalacturonide lyase